ALARAVSELKESRKGIPPEAFSCPFSRARARLPVRGCQRKVLAGCARLDAAAKDDGCSDSDARVGYRRTVVRLGPSSVSNGANADGARRITSTVALTGHRAQR